MNQAKEDSGKRAIIAAGAFRIACSECGALIQPGTPCQACGTISPLPSMTDTMTLVNTAGNDQDTLVTTSREVHGTEAISEMRTWLVSDVTAPERDQADFLMLARIGTGGMGDVHEALQTSIGRPVALKRMRPNLAHNPDHVALFQNEAGIAARLDHPSIATAFEIGQDQHGIPFYTMHLVRGETWHHRLDEQSREQRLDTFLMLCDAVAFAHSRNILHGDIKPGNVMLGGFGEVLLMDWGVAVLLEDVAKGTRPRGGTPCYMSPEQAHRGSHTIDHTSDIYLLGATLYHAVTGKPPRSAETLDEAVAQAIRGEIDPHSDADPLLNIALQAMAIDPKDRYQSVAELQYAVRGYRVHRASQEQSDHADQLLRQAREASGYAGLQEARALFNQALRTWPENTAAATGQSAALDALIERALTNGDLDLAHSLTQHDATAERWQARVGDALAKRTRQQRMVARQRRAMLALTVALMIAFAVGAFISQQGQAVARGLLQGKLLAEQQREAAERTAAPALLDAGLQAVANGEWDSARVAIETAWRFDPDLDGCAPALACLDILSMEGDDSDLRPHLLHVLDDVDSVAVPSTDEARASLAFRIAEHHNLISLAGVAAQRRGNALDHWRSVLGQTYPHLVERLTLTKNGQLSLNLSHTGLTELGDLSDIPLYHLSIAFTQIEDLTPLSGLRLRSLDMRRTPVRNLSPLTGMPLTKLDMGDARNIRDISPLAEMPLSNLTAYNTSIRRIEALRGMPLRKLNLSGAQIESLEPLRGSSIECLTVFGGNTIPSLEPLANTNLTKLRMGWSHSLRNLNGLQNLALTDLTIHASPQVTSLAPIADLPLVNIRITGTGISDLTPLADMELKHLHINVGSIRRGLEAIKAMPSLERITDGDTSFTPAEFWAQVDTERARQEQRLWQALKDKQPRTIRRLIEQRPELIHANNVETGDWTVLGQAVYLEDPGLLEWLVARGASYTQRSKRLGDTLMHCVAYAGCDIAVAEFLMAQGVPIDAPNHGNTQTPLHYTAQYGHYLIAEWLLQNGADPRRTDRHGRTALDYAREKRRSQIIRLLEAALSTYQAP